MAFPVSPVDGQQYTASSGTVYQYTTARSAWKIIIAPTIRHWEGASPPATSSNGDTYYDTVNELAYIRVNNMWLGISGTSVGV